jgi:hypothetical protein
MAVRRAKITKNKEDPPNKDIRMFWFLQLRNPFAVTDDYDRKGTHIRSFYRAPPAASATTPRIDCFKWGSILKAIGKWMTVNVVPSLLLH